jgi:hypothetical protein
MKNMATKQALGENFTEGVVDMRKQLIRKLEEAKQDGWLTKDDEALILEYAMRIIARRVEKPQD